MQCRDVRELADSFLSEELLTETNHEILRHLETCPVCRADVASRRALRESVRSGFAKAPELQPDPEFLARLRRNLAGAALPVPERRPAMIRSWWALAALVLLGVGLAAAFWGRDRILGVDVLAQAAVGDHRHCALKYSLTERPIPLQQAAERYDPAFRILQDVPANDVATAGGPAHVLERHACVYGGRRFAHIVFRYRGTVVSLLVTAGDAGAQLPPPDAASPHVRDARVDAMSVAAVRTSGHVIFLVGDLAQADLDRLADAVAAPLARQLSGV